MCTESGVITETAECLPIPCGRSPAVKYPVYRTDEVLYKAKVEYACQECYSTTGKVDGKTSFEIDCNIKGWFDGGESCMANSCGTPTDNEVLSSVLGEYRYGRARFNSFTQTLLQLEMRRYMSARSATH